jgi:hypothetical protein
MLFLERRGMSRFGQGEVGLCWSGKDMLESGAGRIRETHVEGVGISLTENRMGVDSRN